MDRTTATSANQLTINSASYLLKRKRWLLNFEPFELEQQYLSQRTRDNSHYVKTFLAFGITFVILIISLIAVFWPQMFSSTTNHTLFNINLGMNLGCIIIAPIFIFVISNERFQQIYISLLCIVFLSWKSVYPHLIEDPTFSSNSLYLSISYLIMSAFLTKLRTGYAFITYSSVAIITLLCISVFTTNDNLSFLDYIYATAITCLISFLLAAYQERMIRVNFLKNTILKTQQKELEQLNNRYLRLSKEDPLTGLANRRHLKERLDNEWQRLKREPGPISIIMFDIDCFKKYNDHYGHQMGDSCLIKIATCLKSVIKRPNDLPARYGGEEFIVVLPNTDSDGSLKVANNIKYAIERCAIENIVSEIKPIITVSQGVATLNPCQKNHNTSTKTLIKLADDALYQAKAKGKDQIIVADKNSNVIQLLNSANGSNKKSES